MRRDPQTAAELVAAIALHYGPGPHPDGSAQQVHAGGTTTARPTPAAPARPQPAAKPARRAAKAPAPTAQMAFDFTAPAVDDSPQARFIAAAQAGRVAAEKKLGGGVTDSRLVDYVDDGQGVWKALTNPGTLHNGLREVVAYRLAEVLGMDIVPPTVYSTLTGVEGTSQQFISDLRIGALLKGTETFDIDRFEDLAIFDAVTNNGDRHNGNWGLDAAGRTWAIDHGHTKFEVNYARTTTIGRDDWGKPITTDAPTAGSFADPYNMFLKFHWLQTRDTPSAARAALQAHLVFGYDNAGQPLPPNEATPKAWRVTPAKLDRLGRITQEDIARAVMPPKRADLDDETYAVWRQKAANAYTNLQAVRRAGYLTWW